MKPLYLCEKAYKSSIYMLEELEEFFPDRLEKIKKAFELKEGKFTLPFNGRFLDSKLKGVPKKLRLPFPTTVLEFEVENGAFLIIATENTTLNIIYIHTLTFFKGLNFWELIPIVAQVSNNIDAIEIDLVTNEISGVDVYWYHTFKDTEILNDIRRLKALESMATLSVVTLLSLLEALDCSNVTAEKLVTSNLKKRLSKSPKTVDGYHVLTINTKSNKTASDKTSIKSDEPRHAPREHLRRGHIHRYKCKDGYVTHWINSMIVNPGVGGKILKDYCVK